ncbi:MAG TPA: DNA polymerase III subunit alpha, partial [Sumerlaeia bacterium]|nr:DNA polymerase III subunit alpha [Sumerlaeia bacterium]
VQSGKGEVITQYNMVEVEEVGLLKIDFLGLKNLTIIEDCIRLVGENHGVEIDWAQIGLGDRMTYELLQRGDGFGVFQVESSGMREMLKRAVPSCFEDIVALIALYRPGPMQFMDSFINRKHGREPIEYLHPAMEAILRETYGLMIYQEQVMRVASTLAGFSLGQADVLRRAMGKKKPDEMRKMREAFEKGCADNGIDAGLADEIFDTISRFAEYGFNKSHSAAYAVTTYRTAYLKAHYPAEFMAALLTNEIRGGASDKLGVYIGVAREMGLRVLQPDVNLSQDFFSVVDGHIRFGLAAIKNVGHGPVSHILEVRERGGPFTSFQEFCERIDTRHVSSRAIECLIVAGAFDALGASRPQLLSVMADAIEMGASRREMRESGQTSLFDIMGSDQAGSDLNSVPLPDIPDWPDREKLEREKELAGIFLSGHPLDRYRADIESFSSATSASLAESGNNQLVSMVGIITQVREFVTRKGEAMASVEMEDFEGRFEALFFPRTFDEMRPVLLADSVIFVGGRFSKRPEDETGKILVNRASRIEDFRRSQTRAVEIGVPLAAVTETHLERMRALLRGHRGQVPVRVRLIGEDGEEVLVETAPRFKVSLSDVFLKEFGNLDFEKSLRFVGAPLGPGAGPLPRTGAALTRLRA